MSDLFWYGYAQDYDGVNRIEIRRDGPHVVVWQADSLRDDIDTLQEFIDNFGQIVYNTLEDFKTDNGIDVHSIWPNGE